MIATENNKNYISSVSVGSLISFPACKAHAPYWHLWHVRLYSIFLHYLTNGRIL